MRIAIENNRSGVSGHITVMIIRREKCLIVICHNAKTWFILIPCVSSTKSVHSVNLTPVLFLSLSLNLCVYCVRRSRITVHTHSLALGLLESLLMVLVAVVSCDTCSLQGSWLLPGEPDIKRERKEGGEVEKREGKTEKDSKLEWYRMKTENSCKDVGRRGVNRQRHTQMGRKRV